MIQKHDARRLHYDFRLELDGVLLSWAVPKGPSLDPSVKRLAQETEPHPLEYGGFEGTIPKGQYGGGTVMVWDRGRWLPDGDARAGYEKGHLRFTLEGDKLRGAWHLVRTKGGRDDKSWLLFKARDEVARGGDGEIVTEAPDSVLSGRDLAQIAAANDVYEPKPKKRSARKASAMKAAAPIRSRAVKAPSPRRAKRARTLPASVEPALATLVETAPDGDAWLHEIKLDGYRILARVDGDDVCLLTRNGKDWTGRMPSLAAALRELQLDAALLDGELVALDERGVSSFQRLQNSLSLERDKALVYYAFDLLFDAGADLRASPLLERKQRLAQLLEGRAGERVRSSEHVVGAGAAFFAQACKLGLEGIISKRVDSTYRSGRGRDWVKVKCSLRQEFVVVGYTDPGGTRSHLGALLLGLERDGELTYAGRVGTGFSEQSLRELHQRLVPLAQREPSLAQPPRGADARGVNWVKPRLVAEVAFTGFTDDGLLRHPTFQGLREDKPARQVKLEAPRREYPLTHPDKVLYPDLGITKRDLLQYYELVAERMLPHVANRPLTLVRCPNGQGKPCFFQKHPGAARIEGLRSIAIREKEGKSPYSVLDDAQGLFALVQLGALEIHTWGSRADDFERPDLLVFDLDPDPKLEFKEVIRCAQRLRELFASAKLESFVKTTGGKGLHVCIPFEPDLTWPEIKAFAEQVAEALAAESPDRYLANQSKARRKGKIFIDYLRNGRGATFIAPYSTRAREGATVAVPLEWDELGARTRPDAFNVRNLAARLTKLSSDPFQRMSTLRQRLRPKEIG